MLHDSRNLLAQAHPKLQAVVRRAAAHVDITVIEAHRNRADQEKAFRSGNSKVHYGDSAHNYIPSLAVDIGPWPLNWKDLDGFKKLQPVMFAAAVEESVALRWGGDFNMDGKRNDSFVDLPHYELHPWRDYKKDAHL